MPTRRGLFQNLTEGMRLSLLLFKVFLLVISGSVATASQEYFLLSTPQFVSLSQSQQQYYLKGLRQNLVEFEESLSDTYEYSLFNFLIPVAKAKRKWGRQCIIGGVTRPTVNGTCPSRGRGCPGKADSFQCGGVFGGICVSRIPVGSISSRCNSAAPLNISPQDYEDARPSIEDSLEKICQGKAASTIACRKMKQKFNQLKRDQAVNPTPTPRPSTTPAPTATPAPAPTSTPGSSPTPRPSAIPKDASKVQTPGSEECEVERDQGKLGTCHAFCLTCTYDAMMRVEAGKKMKSSANWIAMISVVNRVCDNKNSEGVLSNEIIKNGWHPNQTMNIMASVGACDEKKFHPYSMEEGYQRLSKSYSSPDPNGAAKKASQKGHVNVGSNWMKPSFDDAYWKSQFGIAGADAYDLFCPTQGLSISREINDRKGYESRLERMNKDGKLSSKFYECAKEALENARKLKPSEEPANCKYEMLRPDRKDNLKEAIQNSKYPIPTHISTSVDGHGAHCITTTGFDDDKKEFSSINSWGKNAAFNQIPYSKVDSVNFIINPACMVEGGGGPLKKNSGSGIFRWFFPEKTTR